MHDLTIILAYGQFKSSTFAGMFVETWPHFAACVVPAFLLYLVASVLTEVPYCRWLGVLVFLIGMMCTLPEMAVMGAWGPAHVGVGAAMPAWLAFPSVLLVKAFLTPSARTRRLTLGCCSACGYDTSHCFGPACPECGARMGICHLRTDR